MARDRGPRPPDLDPRSALALAAAFAVGAVTVALVRGLPRILAALAVGTLLALALSPLVALVQRRLHSGRTAACALVLGALVFVLALVAVLVVPPTARQAGDLPEQVPEVVADIGDLPVVGDDLVEADVPEKVDEFLDDLPERLSGEDSPLDDVASGITDGLVAALVTLLLAVTLLLDGEALVARARRVVPSRQRDRADRLARIGYQVVGRYVAGSVLVAVMASTYILILGLALGVPLAPLAAAWILMTNLIPQIGGALGGIPFVALGLTQGIGTGLACAAGFLVYQQIENNLISPVVIGQVVKLSPPVTMAAALIGVSAGGVVGALIAVPVVGAVKAVYLELRPGDAALGCTRPGGSGAIAVSTGDDRAIQETEAWFISRGLPHFIANYSATRDVLTRAVPVLTLVFLIEIVNAPKRSFPIWLNVLAVAGGFAILLGAWIGANAFRGRPLLERPVDVGPFEVAVFVLAPALIPLVFGGQWRSALVTFAVNVGLLAAIYFVTSYGIIPMTRWAAGETSRELNAVVGLFVRAMPLLVLFVTFTFLQNEAWQITAELYGPFYWIVLALFPIVGVLFAVIRLPREVGALSEFESWSTLLGRVVGTPVEALARTTAKPTTAAPPLGRRQWGNVGLVVLFSQALQVLLVSSMVFAFLFGFGVLVMTEPLVESFVGAPPHVLATLNLWGRHMVVTEELLRVTGFLTVFSGFYFAVSVLTDETYRSEFLEEVVGEIRRALAVRAVYLAALERPEPSTISST